MLSIEDTSELIIAITGLVVAITGLVAAFRNVHDRLDRHGKAIGLLSDLYLRSSTKVPPEDNSE
jgi:hypothetical protein